MKIGILTGGGDTQALNSVLYGAACESEKYGHQLIGFKKGWEGVLNPLGTIEMGVGILNPRKGGTFLKSSRRNLEDSILEAAAACIQKNVNGLIAIGGDDTLSVGNRLMQYLDIPIVFVTKTIDNDVGRNAPDEPIESWQRPVNFSQIVNYFTLGFPTAAGIIKGFAEDLRTTGYSHERVLFLESMGRSPGWLALSSFAADPSPDFILVPECPVDYACLKEKIAERYQEKKNVLVVVAEGAKYIGSTDPIAQDEKNKDTFGHAKLGGVADILADRIKKDLKIENCNAVNPGLLYRSGAPCTLDQMMGISLGELAVQGIAGSKTGYVAVTQKAGDHIMADLMPAHQVISTNSLGVIQPRQLDPRFYDTANYCITESGKQYFSAIGIGKDGKK